MLKIAVIAFSIFFSLLSSMQAIAEQPEPTSAVMPIPIPTHPQQDIIAPEIDAKAFILMDANTGKILAEKNADQHLPPASLTKLISMYVISDALARGFIHPDDKVRISEKAWKTGGSRMFLQPNSEVPIKQLLEGIVVASGNDATVAMAEYLAGSESAFATLMNNSAAQIGMKNSHFVDSSGLPNPNHYSSAHDLALLAQAIIQKFPEDYKLYSEKWFSYNHIRQPNRNRLLWHFPTADGLKTGHTAAAGFCLVGSAQKGDMRLISVVLGAPSDAARTEDSIRLLTWGFRFFETQKLYSGQKSLTQARIRHGEKKEVSLGLARDLYITLPAGQFKKIHVSLQPNQSIFAPIAKNQEEGQLVVSLDGKELTSVPLIAIESVKKGSLWHNIADSISFHVGKAFSHPDEIANNG